MSKEAEMQHLKNMTIVRNMDDVSFKTAKQYIKKEKALHLRCSCGADIFIGIGCYKNPNFEFVEKRIDSLESIYKYTCPSCNETKYIEAKELRVLHFKEES